LKERAIGACITLSSVIVTMVYLLLFYLGYGWQIIAILVSVAVFALIGILGWIGWTMATAPSLKTVEVKSKTQQSVDREARKNPNAGLKGKAT